MAKIDKDQFEEYLEQHQSVEEPSPEVFQKLQKEAVWNNPPSSTNNTVLVAAAVLSAILLLLAAFYNRSAEAPDARNLQRPTLPVHENPVSEPGNVIALNNIGSNMGSYRFMKHKSDDFNLSFHEDSPGQARLGLTQDLDSI